MKRSLELNIISRLRDCNRKKPGVRSLVILFLVFTSCVSLGTIDTQAGPYRVSMTTQPAVVPVGRANLTFSIKNKAGKPLDGLQVKAIAQMPSMPMGEREQAALPVPGSPGTYSLQAAFAMAGSYDVTLRINGQGGSATAVIPVQTGQDTSVASSQSFGSYLPWVFASGVIVTVLILALRSRQNAAWKAAFTRTTIVSILILVAMLLISMWAVRSLRRPGSMTPMEAQGMQMETPAPPGTLAVQLATVEQGNIAQTVRYSGQAVGYVEQDVTPRVTGVITSMPFYVGNRVKRGDVLIRLDTSQLDPQLAERAAMTNMAAQGADVAVTEYQAALQEVSQARADLAGKQGMLSEARSMVDASLQDEQSMEAEVASMQSDVVSAKAEVASAEQEATFRNDELARNQSLFDKSVVSKSELQEAAAANSDAQSKLSQARAMVRQTQAKVNSAQANVLKSKAMIAAAKQKVIQAQAEVRAGEAEVRAKQMMAEAAKKNIRKEQAGVAQARAGYESASAQRSYAAIAAEVDGVVTDRLISPGVLVNPGQIILKVAQMSPIRLQANVAAVDLQRIRVGARVAAYTGGEASRPIYARVTSVAPSMDLRSRTGMVEALVTNEDGKILPGQFVDMQINVSETSDATYVPVTALQMEAGASGNDQSFIWLAEPTGDETYRVKQVFVKTGSSDGKNVQLIGDIKAGDKVVTVGGSLLRNGSEVSAPMPQVAKETAASVQVSSNGFSPDTITIASGKSTIITFTRVSDQGCGTEVVFRDLGIRKSLPLNVPVAIELTPKTSGVLTFTCGLNMYKGKVVIQ